MRRERSLFRSASDLGQLRVATASGVYPLEAFAAVRKMPPPMAIRHHDGRRELGVLYNFNTLAPQSGPARTGLDRRIHDEIRNISRPNGYTIETPAPDEGTGWFKKLVAPVLLLLFAVLAITFESVTLPILILVALGLSIDEPIDRVVSRLAALGVKTLGPVVRAAYGAAVEIADPDGNTVILRETAAAATPSGPRRAAPAATA